MEREELAALLDYDTMQYVSKLTNILDFLGEAYISYAGAFQAYFLNLEIDYGEVIIPIVDSEVSAALVLRGTSDLKTFSFRYRIWPFDYFGFSRNPNGTYTMIENCC